MAEFVSEEQRDAYVRALEEERAGYLRFGQAERAGEVDVELERLGAPAPAEKKPARARRATSGHPRRAEKRG